MIIFATRFDSVSMLWIIAIVALVIIEIIISTYLSVIINKLREQMQVYNRKKQYYATIMTVYDQHQTLAINSYVDIVLENYNKAFDKFYKLQKKEVTLNTLNNLLGLLLKYALLTILLVYFLTQFGTKEIAGIWLIVNITTTFTDLMNNILTFVYKASINREVVDIYAEVSNFNQTNYIGTNGFDIKTIEFKDVSFKYDNEWILKNCSFILENEKKYALIGRNGSGKTTITNLLLGFYIPTEGQILINGKPLGNYDISAIRASIATVFQENNIYPTNLNENIAMDIKEQECEFNSLEQDNFSILDKYKWDTQLTKHISEEGVELSGGEENQVAMLRALKKSTNIYVFDEPNSSLDIESENKMYKLLDIIFENKSLLMITHRMEACQHVDQILFLKDGNISESGSHSELINIKNGDYANFYQLQSTIRLGGATYE